MRELEQSKNYNVLYEYATKNRLDYNELCRVARAALEPSQSTPFLRIELLEPINEDGEERNPEEALQELYDYLINEFDNAGIHARLEIVDASVSAKTALVQRRLDENEIYSLFRQSVSPVGSFSLESTARLATDIQDIFYEGRDFNSVEIQNLLKKFRTKGYSPKDITNFAAVIKAELSASISAWLASPRESADEARPTTPAPSPGA